jgi:ATP-dependent protease HslVU (ClpYQ) ATPase subunit
MNKFSPDYAMDDYGCIELFMRADDSGIYVLVEDVYEELESLRAQLAAEVKRREELQDELKLSEDRQHARRRENKKLVERIEAAEAALAAAEKRGMEMASEFKKLPANYKKRKLFWISRDEIEQDIDAILSSFQDIKHGIAIDPDPAHVVCGCDRCAEMEKI